MTRFPSLTMEDYRSPNFLKRSIFLRQCDFLKDWKQTKLVLKIHTWYCFQKDAAEKLFPNPSTKYKNILREWRRNQHSKMKENRESTTRMSVKGSSLSKKETIKEGTRNNKKKQKTNNMITSKKIPRNLPKKLLGLLSSARSWATI